MVEHSFEHSFPVYFFDGEREMNIGDVKIVPTLEYKPFQLMISQKIGISPNQISIYLVDRRKKPKSPFSEERRRIPITGKVNFSVICRQRDCCFLVVLKRSRKSRGRRERMVHGLDFADFLPEQEFPPPVMHSVPENLILLRRNQAVPFHDQITQSELADLNDRLKNLRIRRENYQAAMDFASDYSSDFGSGHNFNPNQIPNFEDWYSISTPSMMTNNKATTVYCEECVNAEKEGKATPFHHCVNDAVVATCNTRLGPISRPNKPFP